MAQNKYIGPKMTLISQIKYTAQNKYNGPKMTLMAQKCQQ
jgi:hypothetical protein